MGPYRTTPGSGPYVRAVDLFTVARVLGVFAIAFSLTMLLPLLVGLWCGETFVSGDGNTLHGFASGAGVGVAVGLVLSALGWRARGEFFRREGILTVALLWVLVGFLGSLPFWLSGWFAGYWDCFFESASGLTTTGSSVLGAGGNRPIHELPPSLLFWRAWLHWLGGIGIVVMFLAFLPALGITEKTLFQAEIAGVSKEGLRPRIRHSTLVLLRIYLVITAGLLLAYLAFGLTPFEAVCHSFATIATGGFSTHSYSVGGFGGLGIEVVAIVGMLMAATNFSRYHRFALLFRPMFRGRRWPDFRAIPRPRDMARVFFGDPEFRFYFSIFAGAVVLLTAILMLDGGTVPDQGEGRLHAYAGNLGTSLRDSAFQTASMISSTGFANSDLLAWPLLAQVIILVIMLGGGCSGSTGGGIKAVRVLILFKLVGRSLRRFLRPRVVEPLRVGREAIDNDTADRIIALAACWMLILVFGTVLLLFLETRLDVLGAFSSMVTSLCNMGPAFTGVIAGEPYSCIGPNIGSYGSFGELTWSAKAFMGFIMILGRLEVFTPLIILFPSFWRD